MATEQSTKKWQIYVGSRQWSFQSLISQSRGLVYIIDLTFKDNYETGGLAVDLKKNGSRKIDFVFLQDIDTGYQLNYVDGKILAYANAAELANGNAALVNKKAVALVFAH